MITPSKHLKSEIQGDLLAFSYKGENSEDVIGLYGDPKGLRALGLFLLELADLDQNSLPSSSLPATEGIHIHLRPGSSLNEKSLSLDIGRLDAKEDGDKSWMLGAFDE